MRWKAPDEWAKLKSGETCPMCQDIHLDVNPFSFLVAELPYSYVRLSRNQWMRGWTIVALKRHACEFFDMNEQEVLLSDAEYVAMIEELRYGISAVAAQKQIESGR